MHLNPLASNAIKLQIWEALYRILCAICITMAVLTLVIPFT